MPGPRRKRRNTAVNMGNCFSTDKPGKEDKTSPPALEKEKMKQGKVSPLEKQQREATSSGVPEKCQEAGLQECTDAEAEGPSVEQKTCAGAQEEQGRSTVVGAGSVNCKSPSTEGGVIKDLSTQAEDSHCLEHKQTADRLKGRVFTVADSSTSAALPSEVLQEDTLFGSASPTETPVERDSQLASTRCDDVATVDHDSGTSGLATEMRQDRKPDRSQKAGKQGKNKWESARMKQGTDNFSSTGKAKISTLAVKPAPVKSGAACVGAAKGPHTQLSRTGGEAASPQETTPGQDAGKDKGRPDQGVLQDNLVQSLAKGPKESANLGHSPLKEVEGEPMKAEGGTHLVDEDNGEEDLYRAAEEIEEERDRKSKAREQPRWDAAPTDRFSVAAEVGLLCYSQREWRGNTVKSTLIRKGYEVVAQHFQGLRRVRGDNYCALRATLFQALSYHPLPDWLQHKDITQWPLELLEGEDLIKLWRFPQDLKEKGGFGSTTECLKYYLDLLNRKWQDASRACSFQERQQVCEQVFQGGEVEYGLLEAIKLLMLCTAVELHGCMLKGDPIPVFCWLLFARDSSSCPRAFLVNHLSHVGFSGGLEQVEMFLLGYTLQRTIQVYRLYKAETEEFVTYYPDDHKEDWPCLHLVTEDDRHYNILVALPNANSQKSQDVASATPEKHFP